jgi:hypothetical protein
MKFANATKLDRKSGVAERRDLLCAFPERNCTVSPITNAWPPLVRLFAVQAPAIGFPHRRSS